jgi:hypothetical protein
MIRVKGSIAIYIIQKGGKIADLFVLKVFWDNKVLTLNKL